MFFALLTQLVVPQTALALCSFLFCMAHAHELLLHTDEYLDEYLLRLLAILLELHAACRTRLSMHTLL